MTRTVLKTHERKRHQFATTGPSLTHQSAKQECDINSIMKKWEKTGVIEHRNTFEGTYADFTDTPTDYHTAMNQIIAANEMFETLPAKIRKRFGNDPGTFLDFVGDAENVEEMIKLGLATRNQDDVLEDVQAAPAAKKPKPTAPEGYPGSDGDPGQ